MSLRYICDKAGCDVVVAWDADAAEIYQSAYPRFCEKHKKCGQSNLRSANWNTILYNDAESF